MAKPMTPMEQAVGRRLPNLPKHLDTVMARWAEDGDAPTRARFPPSEEWLRPAFRKAVKNGWLRNSNQGISFMGSKPDWLYLATDTGFAEATAAKARVDAINEARAQWARDSQLAVKDGRFPPKSDPSQ
jgi:hypothetical protein